MLLSTPALASLVVIVKRSVDIWTNLLTGGQRLASRMDLDGKVVLEHNYRKKAICFKNTHTKCMERFNMLNAFLNHSESTLCVAYNY